MKRGVCLIKKLTHKTLHFYTKFSQRERVRDDETHVNLRHERMSLAVHQEQKVASAVQKAKRRANVQIRHGKVSKIDLKKNVKQYFMMLVFTA